MPIGTAGKVVHDLGNNLQAIIGHLQMENSLKALEAAKSAMANCHTLALLIVVLQSVTENTLA